MTHFEAVLGLVLGLIAVITSIAGALAWYRSRVAYDVAKQRDFEHLKNNYKQLAANVEQLWIKQDERFDLVDRQLDRIENKIDPSLTAPRYSA